MKKKLQLNKETMAVLNGRSMSQVVGGAGQEEYCNSDVDCAEGLLCVQGICIAADGESGWTIINRTVSCPTQLNTCFTCATCVTCQTYCLC